MHLDVDLTAAVISFLVAFIVSAVSGRFLIPFLRDLKAGQTERSDGPKSHLKKTGTPNMGGLMILLGVTVGCLLPFKGHGQTFPVLILTIGFGMELSMTVIRFGTAIVDYMMGLSMAQVYDPRSSIYP